MSVKQKENKDKINFRLAVKAFIVHNNKLLVVKRSKDDIQMPNIWELPGGRLNPGEDPFLGIIREVREETGLYIKPLLPMSINHFQRDDGQTITMIVSFCKPIGGRLNISHEHQDIEWIDLNIAKEKITKFYFKDIDYYNKMKLNKFK